MPGEAVTLGPFSAGLNNVNNPAYLEENECQTLINFDVDLDGSLKCRPGFKEIAGPSAGGSSLMAIGGFHVGTPYIVFSKLVTNGVYRMDQLEGWVTVTTGTRAKCCFQYQDLVWIPPAVGATSGTGGSWDESTDAFTTDTDIPNADGGVIWRDRLWLIPGDVDATNNSRLNFSDEGDPGTWPAANFIDINPGDGEVLTGIGIYNDSLLLMKSRSCYILSFDLSPADAVLKKISSSIGGHNPHCLVEYENSVFIMHESDVYEIVNYEFVKINDKCHIGIGLESVGVSGSRIAQFICIIGDRLIARFGINTFAYSIKTQTWSKWESQSALLDAFGPAVELQTSTIVHDGDPKQYYMGNDSTLGGVTGDEVFYMRANYDSEGAESTIAGGALDIQCTIKTKEYTFGAPFAWKRLFWWGAEVSTGSEVEGTLQVYKGAQVIDINTISDAAEDRFVKFEKSVRFRQISFQLEVEATGGTDDGPCRVWTIIPFLRVGQIVEKAVQN